MSDAEQIDAVYRRAGFGGSAPRGERPAVIVVDLVRAFTEPDSPIGADLTPQVEQTNAVIAAARRASLPVLFTSIEYSPAEVEGDAIAWLAKSRGLRCLLEGSPEVELDPRLDVRSGDPLIVKKGASAFFGTSLAAMLVALGADSVVVCGATTSGCVRATVVDAVQSGFHVMAPEGCLGDRAAAPHNAALFDIREKYGDVVQVEEAVAHLASLVVGGAS